MEPPLSRVTLGRTLRTRCAAGVLIHDSKYDANAWMPRHAHASASVTVVLSGEQLDLVDGEASRCVGLVTIIKPSGAMHETECGPAGCRSATIEVPARIEQALRLRFGLFERCEHLDSGRAASAVLRVWGATRDTDNPEILENQWLSAAGELALACRGHRSIGGCGLSASAMKLIDVGLGVAQIAKELRVHPVHLCRVMKKATGRGTVQNIRWARVRRGIESVLAGSALAASAIDAGFSDQSHMTREMTREIGMSPAADV